MLRVGIFTPKHHDLFVAEVPEVPEALEHQESQQSSDRQSGAPFRAVKRPKIFFKTAPINRPNQTEKKIARIELALQIGE
jgi:hypothetical protein